MAKPIRSLDLLEAELTRDLKWRVQEMWVFGNLLKGARVHEKPALLRGSLALIYAHWEGYIKSAGSSYLEYISLKGLRLEQLRPELAAVALRGDITSLSTSKNSEDHTALISKLWLESNQKALLPYKRTTIRTQANLKFKLFTSIMHSLGLSADEWKGYELLIDEKLLGSRNEISHGEKEHIESDSWLVVRDAVELILKQVRDAVVNAAATQAYLRQK